MTYFGYVSPSSFGGFCLPVPFQNQLLRARAAELEMRFGLGVGEVVLPNCFLGLFETVRGTCAGDVIGCCSLEMLPRDYRLELLQGEMFARSVQIDCLFEYTGVQTDVRTLVEDLDWTKTIGRGEYYEN